MPEQRSTAHVRGLAWVLAALAMAIAPHVPYMPLWVVLLVLAIAAWRWAADLRSWPLPPPWLRGVVVVAATLSSVMVPARRTSRYLTAAARYGAKGRRPSSP